MAKKIKTPVFRVAFPQVFEAKQIKGTGKEKYSIALLFDQKELNKDPQQKKLFSEMKTVVETVAKEKWNKIPIKFKSPFKIGDDQIDSKTDIPYNGYAGMIAINSVSDIKPGLIDQQKNDIIEPGEFYGGCYARATLNAYAWDHPTGGKGVSFGLLNIQKVRDGDSFGGNKTDPQDDFESIETEVEENDESLYVDETESLYS